MPSGVMRLRAARKGGGKLSIEHVKQSTAHHNEGSTKPLSPETPGSERRIWANYPTTKKAIGNESPHRGEGDS